MTEDREPAIQSGDGADTWIPAGVPGGLAAELSVAFEDQADGVEPSADAYRRLAEAVAAGDRPSITRWVRPIGVAASVLLVVGLGGFFLARQGPQRVGTGPATEEVAVDRSDDEADGSADEDQNDGGPESSQPEPSADEDSDDQAAQSADETVEAESGPVVLDDAPTGPVRSTELEAAQAFLDLMRLPYATVELVGGDVVVRSLVEGGGAGSGLEVATLGVARVDGGFAVIEATTESITIDEVIGGDLPNGRLIVSGVGVGFEASVEVTVMAAYDNRVLAHAPAEAGNVEPEPFEAELAVTGAEHGWVLVSEGGGADAVTPPFAARLVTYRSEVDPGRYSVVRIRPDDPDGGLNLRGGPGSTAPLVSVIPAGSGEVARADVHPVRIGADSWWSVSTPAGDQGWVNSRFLASTEPVDEEDLEALVRRLAGTSGLPPAPAELPLTRRAKPAIGSIDDPVEVAVESLLTGTGWGQELSLPSADGPGPAGPLAEVIELDGWDSAEVEVDATFADPADELAAVRYFGSLPRIAATLPPVDGQDRRAFIFSEATPTGPEVVGIIVELTPRP